MALVGSFFTMLVVSILSVLNISSIYFNMHTPDVIFEILQTFILPCACFLSIVKGKITWLQVNDNSSTGNSMVLDNFLYHTCTSSLVSLMITHFFFCFSSIKCQIKFWLELQLPKLHTVILYGQCIFTIKIAIPFTRTICFVSGIDLHFDYCSRPCICWHRHIFISCSNYTKLELKNGSVKYSKKKKNFVLNMFMFFIYMYI